MLKRRSCLTATASLLLPGAGLLPGVARAGGQLEEPLADSVRTALSAAVMGTAPPELEFQTTDARLEFLRWQIACSDRRARRKTNLQARTDFLQTVWYESKRAGLDVSMVMGLVQVESGFANTPSPAWVRAGTCRSCRSGCG